MILLESLGDASTLTPGGRAPMSENGQTVPPAALIMRP
jgi:hypothetical protein